MIVYTKVGVSPISVALGIIFVGKTRHARTNMYPYVVGSMVNYPFSSFIGKHSCRTYHRVVITLLRGTLLLSDKYCCALEGLILGYFSFPFPWQFL